MSLVSNQTYFQKNAEEKLKNYKFQNNTYHVYIFSLYKWTRICVVPGSF